MAVVAFWVYKKRFKNRQSQELAVELGNAVSAADPYQNEGAQETGAVENNKQESSEDEKSDDLADLYVNDDDSPGTDAADMSVVPGAANDASDENKHEHVRVDSLDGVYENAEEGTQGQGNQHQDGGEQ